MSSDFRFDPPFGNGEGVKVLPKTNGDLFFTREKYLTRNTFFKHTVKARARHATELRSMRTRSSSHMDSDSTLRSGVARA